MRARLLRGWCLLGLRLGSPWSRRRVLGWQIRRSTPDFVLLAAGSRIGMPAELLFKRERDGLLFATFVQQRNPLARTIWAEGRAGAPADRRVAADARGPPGSREALLTTPRGAVQAGGSPGWRRISTTAKISKTEPNVIRAYRTPCSLNELPMPTRNSTAARNTVIWT